MTEPSTPPTSVAAHHLLAEGLISLNEAAGDLRQVGGRKPCLATLRRWAKSGCRGHKLETTFLGNRLMTSHQAVARFLAALNDRAFPAPPAPTSAAERAGRELDTLLR